MPFEPISVALAGRDLVLPLRGPLVRNGSSNEDQDMRNESLTSGAHTSTALRKTYQKPEVTKASVTLQAVTAINAVSGGKQVPF